MHRIRKKHIRGQSLLEVGMALSLTIVIIMATVRVWQWATGSMALRFFEYQKTRKDAVRRVEDGTFGEWNDPGNLPLPLVPR